MAQVMIVDPVPGVMLPVQTTPASPDAPADAFASVLEEAGLALALLGESPAESLFAGQLAAGTPAERAVALENLIAAGVPKGLPIALGANLKTDVAAAEDADAADPNADDSAPVDASGLIDSLLAALQPLAAVPVEPQVESVVMVEASVSPEAGGMDAPVSSPRESVDPAVFVPSLKTFEMPAQPPQAQSAPQDLDQPQQGDSQASPVAPARDVQAPTVALDDSPVVQDNAGVSGDDTAGRTEKVPPVTARPLPEIPAVLPERTAPAAETQTSEAAPVGPQPAADPKTALAMPVVPADAVVEEVSVSVPAPAPEPKRVAGKEGSAKDGDSAPLSQPGASNVERPAVADVAATLETVAAQAVAGQAVADERRPVRLEAPVQPPDGEVSAVRPLDAEVASRTGAPDAPPQRAPLAPDQERMIARVASAIEQAEHAGRSTVRVRLYPPELGTVRIEVSSHRGVVTARIEASTPQTHGALQSNLAALRSDLRQAGIDVRSVEVQQRNPGLAFGLENRSGSEARYNASPNARRPRAEIVDDPTEPVGASVAAYETGVLNLLI